MTKKRKRRKLIFGNQAVVQGALEAGVGLATSYPGTPASEIGDGLAQAAEKKGLYFEYSSNEKVALETAAGAAFSGVKSLVAMKHYGLNVAIDALLPLVYQECPLVVVVADDPGSWSSVQAEQDSRWYSRLGQIPTLEPSNGQEAKEMTKEAFRLAWQYKLPIMVRMTTRVSLTRSLVEHNPLPKQIKTRGEFKKPKDGFKLGSQVTVKLHQRLIKKISQIKQREAESKEFNIVNKAPGKIGLITTGVAHSYSQETMRELGIDLPTLKIGLSYPFPTELVQWFIQNLDQILVLEELDPIIEQEVERITAGRISLHGKNLLPQTGEFKPDDVLTALSKLIGKELGKTSQQKSDQAEIEKRTPFFCPGCPHRATFYAVKQALGKDRPYYGDIGCYMLGSYPPYQLIDSIVSMGSSIGLAHGIAQSTKQKPVVFIGDSTFLHAGIPGLINLVFHQDDILVVILDNRYTAMTGQQPNPGTNQPTLIEDIVKAVNVDRVERVNAYNIKKMEEIVKELYQEKGVSVLIAKGECRLALWRQMKKKGQELPKFEIIKQGQDLVQLEELDCPAIQKKKGKYLIDPHLCSGCSVCQQIAPRSIKPKKKS